MSYSYNKRTSSSQLNKNNLLKDNSWIRRDDDEDEAVDRDPNPGKAVLNRYRSNESLNKTEPAKSTKTAISPSSSVNALTKRFSASQDELSKASTRPSSYDRTSTSYTKSTSSTLKADSPKTTTTTTTTKDGTTKTTTTSQSVSSSKVVKSPPKTESFTQRVFSDVKSPSKGTAYSPPPKTTKVSEKTEVKVTSNKVTEDQLFDTLIPTSIKTELMTPESTPSVSKTETVTVKTIKDSPYGDGSKTTTTTRTLSTAEDELFDTLLPRAITSGYSTPDSTTSITKRGVVTVDSTKGDDSKTVTSPTSNTKITTSYKSYSSSDDVPSTRTTSSSISSKPSEDYTSTSTRRSYSSMPDNSEDYTSTSTHRSYSSKPDNSYEYSSVTSPTVYNTTSSKDSSRPEDQLADSLLSKSVKSVYSSPDSSRTVHERDLCSYCRKPMNSEAKMVLDDMRINCHASCFKCQVCNSTLGHLKAGDSLWIYRREVLCESCFGVTREKWRR